MAATAVVEVAAPFPAVGATATAAAPAVVAALRVRVPGPGVVCVFQPLPRLLLVLDEDVGSVGRRGQPWFGEDLCAGTVGVGGAISARCG